MKKHLKVIIDVMMLIIYLFQMSYRISHAPGRHALFGVFLFALFIFHHILNVGYIKAIFKGKYNTRRTILLVSDLLLLLSMLLVMFSAIMLSGMVIESPIPVYSTFHTLHTAATAWCFILMAIHLSLHMNRLYLKLKRRVKGAIYYLILALISMAGMLSFMASTLPTSLFIPDMSSEITLSYPVFYLQYCFIIGLVSVVVHLALEAITKRQRAG